MYVCKCLTNISPQEFCKSCDPPKQLSSTNLLEIKTLLNLNVNKNIFIGIAWNTLKNHHSVSVLSNIMKLNKFLTETDNTFACDLKMANILIGLMSHT